MVSPDPSSLVSTERKNGDFNPKSMHSFIEGSAEKSDKIIRLTELLERDPVLSSSFKEYDESEHEEREKVATRIMRMANYLERGDPSTFWRLLNLVTVYDPSLGIRISVNLGLFLNCIKGNGTASQYEYWANQREAGILKQVYGCFGMTELGHGSNVAGCETLATFDKETDEFIIHTPHIAATKWWIGGAAHSATHSSVYARLIVDGKDYGVKTFVVPLRDTNHELLPGIAIGDIGSKMGRRGVDNGWIQFSDVRIPRYFMLQKWCQVSRDGKVTLPPLEQLSYISLLGGRVFMATDSYRICARFITIALRYAVGRRQFKTDVGSKPQLETQLIDYPLHQKRLLPYLALTYAMAIATNKLELQIETTQRDMDTAVKANDSKGIAASLEATKLLFIDSGSLKSSFTFLAADCINETRQSCGGHGYSNYNGFGKSYDDWVVQCTWEGDNNVLAMSVGKTIIKNLDSLSKGKKANMNFLNKNDGGSEIVLSSLTPSNILDGLASLIIRLGGSQLSILRENGWKWDYVSAQNVVLSKLRCHYYTLEALIEQVSKVTDPNLKPHLDKILQLYALTSIVEQFSNQFIAFGVMDPQNKKLATYKLVPELFSQLRPYVIPLTDSFLQPDGLLHSAIGKYNGDVYENYFQVVKSQNPSYPQAKAPYSELFEKALKRPSLEARERFEKTKEAAKTLSK